MTKIDINIVKWIQENLRSNIMDHIIYGITQLGDAYFFIFIVVILFWTVDKKFAYKMFFGFISAALANSVFKVIVKRQRPFTHVDEGIVSVFEESTGYAFPSGHSAATGSLFYGLNTRFGKNKIIKGFLIAGLILVPFSRLYLGQHFITDVIVGVAVGILMTMATFKLYDIMGEKEHIYPLYLIPVIIIGLIFFLGKDYNKYNELFVVGGGYIGFTLGYFLEKLYVKHDVTATTTVKILKVLLGIVIVFGIYLILKSIFPNEDLLFAGIRYMMVALSATALAPFIFTKIFKTN